MLEGTRCIRRSLLRARRNWRNTFKLETVQVGARPSGMFVSKAEEERIRHSRGLFFTLRRCTRRGGSRTCVNEINPVLMASAFERCLEPDTNNIESGLQGHHSLAD